MKANRLLLAGLAALVTGCVSVFVSSFNYNLAVKNIGKEDV